jgi:hypothetical protein
MVFGIGAQELVIGAVLIGAIALFGRKIIVKGYKDILGIQTDLKAVKEAHEGNITPEKVKAKKV